MAKAAKQVSEIDRLIELASEERPNRSALAPEAASPGRSPSHSLSLEDQKDPRPSMWRVLLQMRVLLPYLAKVLPLVERGLLGTNVTGHALGGGQAAPAFDTSRLDGQIAGLSEAQRDVNNALKAQGGEVRLLQEQVASLTKLVERDIQTHQELAATMIRLGKTLRIWAMVVATLLGALIGLLLAFTAFGPRAGNG